MTNTERDNDLAALTDAVLEGRSMTTSTNTRDMERVIIQLRDVIDPDTPPDPTYSMRLARRMDQEFDLLQRAKVRKWPNQRMVQLVGMAAAIVVVMGIAIVFSGSSTSTSEGGLSGSAVGDISVLEAITLAVVAVGLSSAAFFLMKRRR
ncbi:MAG: hypothetical protein HY862_06620 [Chloroflexi bacterium]|nr:hypothetical protein [Chloroflexota bacterium]